jgi:hypothetical protein
MTFSPVWQFVGQVAGLIWSHKLYSLAIFGVTILQEFAALWPVNLLGDFVDRLDGGDLGNVVWLLMGASVLSPAIQRANVILRHKMFYETDYEKRVELVLKDADSGEYVGSEAAGAAYTRTVNAVSGITNAAYHVLGSFTPVIIKAVIVSGRLLGYNQLLGLVYLATLLVPGVMTLLLNNKLRVLRDSQYSVMGDVSGAGIRTIGERDNEEAKGRFLNAARLRTDVLIALVAKGQSFLYVREAALIGSQFLVVFLALSMRQQIGITAGDFTKIVGYTAQVAAAFISAASCLDSIISNSRAYHVYSTSGKAPLFPVAPIRPPRGKAVR